MSGFAHVGFWNDKSRWKNDTNEDEGFAVARFRNGVWLTLKVSSIESNPRPGILDIAGTEGSYVMGHSDYTIYKHEGGAKVVRSAQCRPGESWRYYANVAEHLVKGKDLVISAEWSRRPIHIIDLAVRSAKLGKTLKAKYV